MTQPIHRPVPSQPTGPDRGPAEPNPAASPDAPPPRPWPDVPDTEHPSPGRRSPPAQLAWAAFVGASLLALATGTGCAASLESEPVAYAEVDSAPVETEIATYPTEVYEGRPVYYYRDRWWYRGDGGRWVYYRQEPEPLRRRRGVVVQGGPAPTVERAPVRATHERVEHEHEREEHERR